MSISNGNRRVEYSLDLLTLTRSVYIYIYRERGKEGDGKCDGEYEECVGIGSGAYIYYRINLKM